MNLALLCSSTAPPTYSSPTSPLPISHISWTPQPPSPVAATQRHPSHITGIPPSPTGNPCRPPFSPPIDGPSVHIHFPPRYPQQLQYFQEQPSEPAGYSEMSMMQSNERHRWIANQYNHDQHAYTNYGHRHLEDRSVHPTSQAQPIYPYYGSYGSPQAQHAYAQYDTNIRTGSFQQHAYPPGVPPPLPTPVTPEGKIYPNTSEVPPRTTFLQTDLERVADNCNIIARFAAENIEAMRSPHGSQPFIPPELMRKMCGRAYEVLRTLLVVGGPAVDPRSLMPGASKGGDLDPGDIGSENGENNRDSYSDLKPRTKYRKRNKRSAPPAPGRCHSCNISETPEWRKGPDGARTLCNACGLHFAKLTRKRALAERKSAELKRLETIEQGPASYVDASNAHSDSTKNGDAASSDAMPSSSHESSLKRRRLEGQNDASFVSESPQYPDTHNSTDGTKNGIGVPPSLLDVPSDPLVASSTSEENEASTSRENS